MYLQGVVTDCYYSGNGHQVIAPPLQRPVSQLSPCDWQPYYPDGCDPSATSCDASKAMLLPIAGNNIIIGNVRIRQLRVKAVAVDSSGCYIPDMVGASALLALMATAHLPMLTHFTPQIKNSLGVKCYFDYSESNEEKTFLSKVYDNFKANNGREPDASEMSWMTFTNHTVSLSLA